jgi:preprotein translocase subunit SecA
MNDQRKAIFEQRLELMSDADLGDTVTDMRHQVVDDTLAKYIPEKSFVEQWDVPGLKEDMQTTFDLDVPIADWAKEEGIGEDEVRERLIRAVDEKAAKKAADFGPQIMRQIEKAVLLQTLDHLWREHLITLEHLRQVIGLRGYGQRDPLNEYKSESFTLFEHMLARLREAVTGQLMHVELSRQEDVPPLDAAELPPMEAHHFDPTTGEDEFALEAASVGPAVSARGNAAPARTRKASQGSNPADPSTWGKVARNAPCPCGSGKKYKHCHGAYS